MNRGSIFLFLFLLGIHCVIASGPAAIHYSDSTCGGTNATSYAFPTGCTPLTGAGLPSNYYWKYDVGFNDNDYALVASQFSDSQCTIVVDEFYYPQCYTCATGSGQSLSLTADTAGCTNVMPCPVGYYYTSTYQLCSPCPPGTYSAGGTSTSCAPCPVDTYIADDQCFACATDYHSTVNSINCYKLQVISYTDTACTTGAYTFYFSYTWSSGLTNPGPWINTIAFDFCYYDGSNYQWEFAYTGGSASNPQITMKVWTAGASPVCQGTPNHINYSTTGVCVPWGSGSLKYNLISQF